MTTLTLRADFDGNGPRVSKNASLTVGGQTGTLTGVSFYDGQEVERVYEEALQQISGSVSDVAPYEISDAALEKADTIRASSPAPRQGAPLTDSVAASQAGQDAVGLPAGVVEDTPCPMCEGEGEVYQQTSVPEGEPWVMCPCCGGSCKMPTPEQIADLRTSAECGEMEAHHWKLELDAFHKTYPELAHPFTVEATGEGFDVVTAVNSHGALVAALADALAFLSLEEVRAVHTEELDTNLLGDALVLEDRLRDVLASVGAESPAGSPSVSRPSAEREGGADGDEL